METTPGRVLAVDLVNRGDRHEAYYFSMPDGSRKGYYDRSGKGIGRGFLRFPVAFKSVTSNFSFSRFHPILKRSIPHYGVDFAAARVVLAAAAVASAVVLAARFAAGRVVALASAMVASSREVASAARRAWHRPTR